MISQHGGGLEFKHPLKRSYSSDCLTYPEASLEMRGLNLDLRGGHSSSVETKLAWDISSRECYRSSEPMGHSPEERKAQ